MAKKPRTPPPPRRVQAPRKREEHRSPEDRRRLLMLVGFGALGLLALAAVIAVLALTGGGSSDVDASGVRTAMQDAGCTYTEKPAKALPDGGMHVPSIDTKVKWNTYPPSGGPHYGETAVWGFYDQPAEPIRIVHNEEHGGVVLWWGPQTSQDEIAKLRELYNESPQAMLGSPIGTIDGKSLGSRIAITAWTGDPETYGKNGDYGTGHVATCDRFDDGAFKKFRDAFRGKGPEGIAMSTNQPGT